jgi:hypothetical protein
MPHTNRTSTLLIGIILLQAAFLLGQSWPSAQAEEPDAPEAVAEPVETSTSEPMDLVCRYFELDEADLRADAHGEINTQNPTGDLEKFLKGDHAGLEPYSMDFEMGQSLSGKPTFWVQVCLRSR